MFTVCVHNFWTNTGSQLLYLISLQRFSTESDAMTPYEVYFWAMRSIVAPVVRQQRPLKWTRDLYAMQRLAPRLTAFASAAFGHGGRPGILRFQGALVIHAY